ncbi:aminotransferase-like domain-containing protein [Albibacillus kandeliae]|uniref:aminotransferase-like domain-containing protein n=1 Tax=Albibacillus kandeliae TaxID=2174228 RepID=UPI000D69E55B|nr:PLP-dependent aminotransferase family protein [Albibacillus kandeliae]
MTRPAFARWLSQTNEVTKTFLAAGQVPDLINLAGGLPEPSVWPVDELAEIAASAVRDHPGQSLAYPPIGGLPALRSLIARKYSSDALPLTRDNVLITSGGMQALDLIGRVLLEQGSPVAAQSPAYLGALDAWRPSLPTYLPMDLEGGDFDPLPAISGAQFAYTVPNFSNPTGHIVDTAMRRRLVEAAEQTGTWLVEDDPYGALYYDCDPLPSMMSMAGSGNAYDGPVIYLGSLSKEVVPGLRIGWAIAAPEMIDALTVAKQGTDMCTSGLSQRIAYETFHSGLADRILPNILATYRARRDALCAAMTAELSDLFTWEVPAGGMFVWARARDPRIDTDDLLQAGIERGVCVSPSSVFDPLGQDHGAIRINFTLNPPERLAEGVRRLRATVTDLLAKAA